MHQMILSRCSALQPIAGVCDIGSAQPLGAPNGPFHVGRGE